MQDSQGRPCKHVIIPLIVWENQNVPWIAKMIFVEIDSFTSNGMECFCSNAHLAQMFQISEVMVSKHIAGLIRMGWIENYKFDGRKRYLRSTLKTEFQPDPALNKSLRQPQTNDESLRQPQTKVKGSIEPEFIHTNSITNTSNLLINNIKEIAIPEHWNSTEFLKEWNRFAEHAFEMNKKKMPPTRRQELTQNLVDLSKGNFEDAKKIIANAIAGGYTKFFELPKYENKKTKPVQRFDDEYYGR